MRRCSKYVLILLAGFVTFLQSCGNKTEEKKETQQLSQFTLIGEDQTGISLINAITENDSINYFSDKYLFSGAGVAVGDINQDGLPDIYFTAIQQTGRLFINKGDFKFEDVTEKLGVGTGGNSFCSGVAMADVNNDGRLDIYVCRSGYFTAPENRSNLLFINNSDGTFSERASEYGLDNPGYSSDVNFFDMDNDGDLDMYLVNHSYDFESRFTTYEEDNSKVAPLVTNRLYENMGDGTFEDISGSAGVLCNTFGLSATTADINRDGYIDLYISNDFFMPDFIWINNGDKTFTESRKQYIKHCSLFSMGCDIADFNNDGLVDIFTLDMLPEDNLREKMMLGAPNFDLHYNLINKGFGRQFMRNMLHLNNGNGSFSEIGYLSGTQATDWSWSPLFADFNNDGLKDLFVSNGMRKDVSNQDFNMYQYEQLGKQGVDSNLLDWSKRMPEQKTPNYLYINNGDLTFTNKALEWGLEHPSFSNGAVYVDLDLDGDLDLVTNNVDQAPFIYRNNHDNKTHYLRIALKGTSSNTFGLGCKVTLTTENGIQYHEHTLTRGYFSTVEPTIHFGLGELTEVLEVKVVWPSGQTQVVEYVKADQVLQLTEPGSDKTALQTAYLGE